MIIRIRRTIMLFAMGVMLCISLCGCGNTTPKSLSGIYVEENGTHYFEFFSGGKYASYDINHSGDYTIDGNVLTMEGVLMGDWVYYFRVNGNRLELSYDDDFEYYDVYIKED